jgi:hypothetical protein
MPEDSSDSWYVDHLTKYWGSYQPKTTQGSTFVHEPRRKQTQRRKGKPSKNKVEGFPLRLCLKPGALRELLNRSPSSHEVYDQYHHSDYEQQVDKAAAYVRKHADQPQDQ